MCLESSVDLNSLYYVNIKSISVVISFKGDYLGRVQRSMVVIDGSKQWFGNNVERGQCVLIIKRKPGSKTNWYNPALTAAYLLKGYHSEFNILCSCHI